MADYWTDPNPQGINRTVRDLLNFQYGVSDTIRAGVTGLGGILSAPFQWGAGKTPAMPDFSVGYSPRPWQMTPPSGAKSVGPTLGPDGKPIIPVSPTNGPNHSNNAPAGMDPLTQLQYDMYQQMLGATNPGQGVNLSGYNTALRELEEEKGRINDRYKKYSGQISDIYGTLTGITQADIANIAPTGASLRTGLSAQEAERAAAARATEEARRATATQAREELGLEELAGEYAGGDVVTEQSEGIVSDSEALRSAAENTLLANEAIAQQSGQNRITGYGLQQEESSKQLQKSLEDALAAIRAEQAQIEMARSQAASQARGGGADWATRMAGLQGLAGLGAPARATDYIGQWMQDNPTAAPIAAPALSSFNNFLQTNYDKLFNENGQRRVDVNNAIQRFRQIASPQDLRALEDANISLFLAGYYNSFDKAPSGPPTNAR
jgi:hypothetical protein